MSVFPSPSTSAQPASRKDSVVACQALTKTFKDFWMRSRVRAVDRLDMVVSRGEVFGLLGPNGSGKSTTIKIILGLLRPSSGRVAVFGKPPTDVATKKRIGYLPEESYLYPFLNARETLDYYAKLFGLDNRTRRQRIDELLEMVGLTHAQHRPVRDYSKGMQRRIGIAQALINDPDLLILDEPTTGLDPIGTRQVKDLIIELGRRGKTIILSSHLLGDVEDVVDRMVILYGGKIRGEGTCEELLAKQQRTTIEADQLDEETLAEIDRIVRERSGGEKSILRVAHPRQKLEELFLGIVQQARAERAETAGAAGEGVTASFLAASTAADAGAEGDELIGQLVEAQHQPVHTEPDPKAESDTAETRADETSVLDELLAEPEAEAEPQVDPRGEGQTEPGAEARPRMPGSPAAGSTPSGSGRPVPPAQQDDDVDLGMIDSLLDDDEQGGDSNKNSGGGSGA